MTFQQTQVLGHFVTKTSPWKCCGDCAMTPLKLHDIRAISAQPPYGVVPISLTIIRRQSHDNRIQCKKHTP